MSGLPPAGSLAAAVLQVLAAEPAGEAMSLPRLGKRLQLEASVVMRELAMLGGARIGSRQGPGWVDLVHDGERWMVRLTDAGRAVARGLPPADTAADDAGAPAPADPQDR